MPVLASLVVNVSLKQLLMLGTMISSDIPYAHRPTLECPKITIKCLKTKTEFVPIQWIDSHQWAANVGAIQKILEAALQSTATINVELGRTFFAPSIRPRTAFLIAPARRHVALDAANFGSVGSRLADAVETKFAVVPFAGLKLVKVVDLGAISICSIKPVDAFARIASHCISAASRFEWTKVGIFGALVNVDAPAIGRNRLVAGKAVARVGTIRVGAQTIR
jgi:hypothetical protein